MSDSVARKGIALVLGGIIVIVALVLVPFSGLPAVAEGGMDSICETGTIEFGAPPAQPTIKKLTTSKPKSTTETELTWGAVAGASAYEVRYKESAAKTWTTVSDKGTTKTISKLKRSVKYDFQVRGYTVVEGERLLGAWSRTCSIVVYPYIVVIDAGHQARGDSSTEPIGPGAKARKPKVASGTSGVATHRPESIVTLEVSKKLAEKLRSKNIKVIMVRTTQKVNISNSKRAKRANKEKADLFIRLHCDGSASSSTKGISTLVPKRNKWTKPIVAQSTSAGKKVHAAVVKATGAKNRGVVKRGDLSGFNWCKVPTVLIEMGFMTNTAEDRKLSNPRYQDKLATGMANGISAWLK